jgi:hypothetical protein
LIDNGILARPLKAAHEATAAALVSSALLLVVVTSHISLVIAGAHLGVAIASHLAFEGLLAFAEEAVHVEGWWIEKWEVSRWRVLWRVRADDCEDEEQIYTASN